MLKLLACADDFDVVYGSRTVKELIWQGANRGPFLNWGSYVVATLMEFLFNATSLTDVGSTMRCVRRGALRELEPHFTVDGSLSGRGMMLLSIRRRMRVIQNPVNYGRRAGHSSATGNKLVAFAIGLRMIRLILSMRLRGPAGRRYILQKLVHWARSRLARNFVCSGSHAAALSK